MYSFARRPKWIAGHILATVLVVSFVAAGFWQLSRHQWRSDLNTTLEARLELPVVDGAGLLTASEDEELRRVAVEGRWIDDDIVIWNRSRNGQPGCHVVSTLQFDDDRAVVVNRGWVDIVNCERPDRSGLGTVDTTAAVTGQLRATQTAGRFQADDPSTGVLESMLRIDVARIAMQSSVDLVPLYVDLQRSAPAEPFLAPVDPPPSDAGPHLGYAFQWFAFAAVGLIGYPLVLRRQARAPSIVTQ